MNNKYSTNFSLGIVVVAVAFLVVLIIQDGLNNEGTAQAQTSSAPQNQAARFLTGSWRTTNEHPITLIANDLPFKLTLRVRAVTTMTNGQKQDYYLFEDDTLANPKANIGKRSSAFMQTNSLGVMATGEKDKNNTTASTWEVVQQPIIPHTTAFWELIPTESESTSLLAVDTKQVFVIDLPAKDNTLPGGDNPTLCENGRINILIDGKQLLVDGTEIQFQRGSTFIGYGNNVSLRLVKDTCPAKSLLAGSIRIAQTPLTGPETLP